MGIIKTRRDAIEADLDYKVDSFIDWYYEYIVKGNYSKYGEYRLPIEMRNLIEKIAVWYELRFPDYEIDRIMNNIETKYLSLNFILDTDCNPDEEWCQAFNPEVFMKLLPWEESCYLEEPRYPSTICLESFNNGNAYLYLTKDGLVRRAEEIESFTKGKLTEKKILDCDLYKIKELLEKLDIKLIENNDLDETIKGAYLWQYQKNCILDCAMYRIIERGGIRIGSRRGLLFALESDGDINVPMKYCVDYSDPGLREFINTYLKAGGSKELECYENYFTRTSDNEALTTITIRDLLLKQKNNEKSFFTKKEDESHQNLVNTLAKIKKKTLHKKRHYNK